MDKPKIRFQGFEEAWCKKTLGEDIANIVGGGTPSTSIPNYWNGNINWFSPTEIGNQRFAFESERKITKEGLVNSSAKLLPANKTILFTSRASIGDMAILKRPATTNQGFQSLVLKKEFNPYFIYSSGFLIKKYALQNASGSTFLEISSSNLSKMLLKTPSLPEQKKIGKLFERIDHLLNLQQRKCDKLNDIKKSMLTKLFPKPGKKVPEVRFKGFTDDWVECKLGEIAEIKTGYPFSSQEFSPNGKYLVITNGNIQDSSSYVDGAIGNRITINNQQILNEYILNTNDILVTMDGSVGRTAKVKDSCQILAQRVGRVIPKRDKEFIYQLLNNGSFSESMENLAHGGTIKHISLSEISSYKNLISRNLSEQQKIGKLFERLDHLISLNDLKLSKLRLLKRSLLDGMFV